MCPCGVGTIYSVLTAGGLNVDERLSLDAPVFVRYQLPDGGLNCEEAAYLRETPHRLAGLDPPAAGGGDAPRPRAHARGRAFLARGAAYLLERQLHISKSTGEVINEDWLDPDVSALLRIRRAASAPIRDPLGRKRASKKLSVASIQASVAASPQ